MELLKKIGIALFGGLCIFYSEYTKTKNILDAVVVGSAAFFLLVTAILIYEGINRFFKKSKSTEKDRSNDETS